MSNSNSSYIPPNPSQTSSSSVSYQNYDKDVPPPMYDEVQIVSSDTSGINYGSIDHNNHSNYNYDHNHTNNNEYAQSNPSLRQPQHPQQEQQQHYQYSHNEGPRYPVGYQGVYGYDHHQLADNMSYAPLLVPAYRRIMTDEFFDLCNDCGLCALSFIFPCCVAGHNCALIENSNGYCIVGCLCYHITAGCMRSKVQLTLGVPDSGGCVNCLSHCCCGVCSLTQETRALQCWVLDGSPAPIPPHLEM